LKRSTSISFWQVCASDTIADSTERQNSSQVFVLVFCRLAQRFHEQAHQSSTLSVSQSCPTQLQSWHCQEDSPSMIHRRSNHTDQTFIDTIRSNPQFRMLNNFSDHRFCLASL
jgi:hypothetical protein